MTDRTLIEIAAAAQRWRAASTVRVAASREKRLATEARRALPDHMLVFSLELKREHLAAKALTTARRNEQNALKVLAKLCDKHTAARGQVEDVLTVDEVRALPRIEAVEVVL